jgi:preprotein translocase subunit YajC
MLISPAYAQAVGGAESAVIMQIVPIVLIFAVFYFLLIRPQQKKVKQHRDMVAALRRGDRIVTAGGIIGTVAKVKNETELLVEIAEGVRVTLVRAQVSEVLSRTGPATPTPANKTDNEEAAAVSSAPEESTGKKISGLFGKKG